MSRSPSPSLTLDAACGMFSRREPKGSFALVIGRRGADPYRDKLLSTNFPRRKAKENQSIGFVYRRAGACSRRDIQFTPSVKSRRGGYHPPAKIKDKDNLTASGI